MNRQQRIEHFLLAAHRLAIDRLKDAPSRLGPVRAQLARWRNRAGTARSDGYWGEWQRRLDGTVDELERAVCADDEHGTVLRSVSPMSTLVTPAERAAMPRAARRE